MNINTNAPVVTNDEILIKSSLDKIWNLHTDILNWSGWNKDITKSTIEGSFQVGKTFQWSTAGMNIESKIAEIIPQKKTAWSGTVQDILGIHVWTFAEVEDGVLVSTHESWEGEPVNAQVKTMQQNLDQSLRAWLESLKRKAESLK